MRPLAVLPVATPQDVVSGRSNTRDAGFSTLQQGLALTQDVLVALLPLILFHHRHLAHQSLRQAQYPHVRDRGVASLVRLAGVLQEHVQLISVLGFCQPISHKQA